MPEISIIIPCYNSEKTISITINSILSQSFTEFEIILINAGTDNLEKTVNQIKDKRIKLYNIEHKGTVYSYIQGIKKSEGKYITFCDSDDTYKKDFLMNAFNDMEKYNCDFSSYPYEIHHEKDGKIELKYNTLKEGLYTNILNNNQIYNKVVFNSFKINKMFLFPMTRWNKIYKKEVLLKIIPKLYDDCIQLEDNIFNLLVYFNSQSFFINNHIIAYRYIKYENSVSNGCQSDKLLESYLYSLERINQLLQKENYTGDFKQFYYLVFDNLRIVYRRIAKSSSFKKTNQVLKQIKKNEYFKKIRFSDLQENKNIIFYLFSKLRLNYFLFIIFKYI